MSAHATFPLLLAGGSRRPFTPASLAGLVVWTDPESGLFQERTGAAATTPADTDTEPVGTWRTAAGQNFTCAADAQRPLYRTGRLGGLPMVVPDGSDDGLLYTAGAAQAFAVGLQLAYVVEAPDAAATDFQFESRNSANTFSMLASFVLAAGSAVNGRVRNDAGALVDAAAPAGLAAGVYEVDWDGSSLRTWKNGVAGTPAAATGTITLDQFSLMREVATTSAENVGFGDFVVYAGQRDPRVCAYLKAKWGLP